MKLAYNILKQLTDMPIANDHPNTFSIWRSEPLFFDCWKQISAQMCPIPIVLRKKWDDIPLDSYVT